MAPTDNTQLEAARDAARSLNDRRGVYRAALCNIAAISTDPAVLKIVREALNEADRIAQEQIDSIEFTEVA